MTTEAMRASAPAWLNRQAYPFAPHYLAVDGGRMHYVDEGHGQPILFVHGTPTWSFLYRDLILALRGRYRCIAADQIGFGLSEKPKDWEYTPAAHARNLQTLIERLDLRNLLLVVHDFGGPIGLSYAVNHPNNLRGLVILNTWMWSVKGWNPSTERVLRILGGPVGRFLYKQFNLSPKTLLPQLFANKAILTRELHQQYLAPFATPHDRQSTWVLARELLGSSDWYEGLWQKRAALAHTPALIAWGMRDAAFDSRSLARWQEILPQAQVAPIKEAGHFVQEEAPDQLRVLVETFAATLVSVTSDK